MLGLLIWMLSSADGAIVSVGPAGDHQTIEDAVRLVGDGDVIEVAAGSYVEADIRKNARTFEIRGVGAVDVRVVSGTQWLSGNNTSVTLTGLTIDLDGRRLADVDDLVMTDVQVEDALGTGGAVALVGGDLSVTGGSLQTVTNDGDGAFLLAGGSAVISGLSASNITAVNGGLIAGAADVTLDGVSVTSAAVSGDGGVVHMDGGSLTLTNSTLSDLSAARGGIGFGADQQVVSDCSLSSLSANEGGGFFSGSLTMTNSSVDALTADVGGLSMAEQAVALDSLTVSDVNVGRGGLCANASSVTLANSSVDGVVGTDGLVSECVDAVVSDSSFSSLTLTGNGAVASGCQQVSMQRVSVTDASVLRGGGAYGCTDCEGTDLVFSRVTALEGGVFHAPSGVVLISGLDAREMDVDAGGLIHATNADVSCSSVALSDSDASSGAVGLLATGTMVASDLVVEGVSGTAFDCDGDCTVSDMTLTGGTEDFGLSIIRGGAGIFRNVVACDNDGAGLMSVLGGSALVEYSIFYSNTASVSLVEVAAGDLVLNHLHLVGNVATNAAVVSNAGTSLVTNSLIAFNEGGGPAVQDSTTSYNLFFENLDYGLTGVLSPTDLSEDPRLVNAMPKACAWEQLIPEFGSPLIDAADPSSPLDADGTRADIGALGGENGPMPPPIDEDGDGFFVPDDCNDADPLIHPGAEEIPCNGVDEDCGGTPDERDADGDGVGECGEDCAPQDPTRYPGAEEIPYDGVDQDCDGVDADDLDGDGFGIAQDCNDADPQVFPGAVETPLDGIDQNCSGLDARTRLNGRTGATCSSIGTPVWLWALAVVGLWRRRSAS